MHAPLGRPQWGPSQRWLPAAVPYATRTSALCDARQLSKHCGCIITSINISRAHNAGAARWICWLPSEPVFCFMQLLGTLCDQGRGRASFCPKGTPCKAQTSGRGRARSQPATPSSGLFMLLTEESCLGTGFLEIGQGSCGSTLHVGPQEVPLPPPASASPPAKGGNNGT